MSEFQKTVLRGLAGGVSLTGPYMLGLFQNANPTDPISAVIGGAGVMVAAILFVTGAFGLNMKRKS